MKKFLIALVAACLAWPSSAAATRPKTFFDNIDRAWAVGELESRAAMEFRDGRVLVFPATITDLSYARLGKPASVMLVWELRSEGDKVPITPGEPFYAPVNVLPRHSFWRDNLPNTPKHEVMGGRRYIFTGDDIEPAKEVAEAYAATIGMDMPERRIRQQAVIVDTLESPVEVLRQDALRRLEALPVPAAHYDRETKKKLADYAGGDAPIADRARMVAVMGNVRMTSLIPDLEALAQRDDIVGAAALVSLDQMDVEQPTSKLVALLDAQTPEVQAFAGERLAARAGDDEAAREAVDAVLESDRSQEVRSATAAAYGRSGSIAAVAPLKAAVYRGDFASRGAALGLARLGTPAAIEALKSSVVEAPTDGKMGAVLALMQVEGGCTECVVFLREQHEKHDSEAVRDMIEIVLELPPKHEH